MPLSPDAVMIFAAGFGTRMGALTAHRPKPLIEVAGKPLLDHALALAEALPARRIAVNAHYRAAQIAAHLSARPGVTVVFESPDILETGGGLRNALPVLGEGPVFTLNSDSVWTGANPLATLARAWDATRMDGLLLLIPGDRALGHDGAGDFVLATDGRLTRGPQAVYSGAQIIDPARLAGMDGTVFSLNVVWNRLIAEGRLHGIVHPGGWCDVGRPESIPLAEAMLRAADV